MASDTKSAIFAVLTSDHLIEPVEEFFEEVLVIDEAHPAATVHRFEIRRRQHALLKLAQGGRPWMPKLIASPSGSDAFGVKL